jgi:hypothetical protein
LVVISSILPVLLAAEEKLFVTLKLPNPNRKSAEERKEHKDSRDAEE